MKGKQIFNKNSPGLCPDPICFTRGPNPLRDPVERKPIVLPRFLRETEERKEEKGAEDCAPSRGLGGDVLDRISAPDRVHVLVYVGETPVSVL